MREGEIKFARCYANFFRGPLVILVTNSSPLAITPGIAVSSLHCKYPDEIKMLQKLDCDATESLNNPSTAHRLTVMCGKTLLSISDVVSENVTSHQEVPL
jgi:hypothetical protein